METVSQGIDDHEKDIEEKALKALSLALGKAGALSVQKTPVDTTNLRRSEFETEPEKDGYEYSGIIGYEADYAIPVHERLNVRHPVGEAKYLEHALQEFESDYLKLLSKVFEL